ncbi:hypothetical protein, partial [Saccharopolyspora sp. 5N708]|uniref:hypothetical protein n=1 Tax=Saccharopolyspora sp. 5N708 TaxID=3457424 RepID=UPI003FD40667
DANNRLAVFALSPTGSVMQTYQTGPGNTRWYDFAGADGNLGGNLVQLVAVASDSKGKLLVYGIGRNGGMADTYQHNRASGPWNPWSREMGGALAHSN